MHGQNEALDTKKNALRRFLARKDIVFSARRYGIDALGAMALGLFGSLLIGTIFKAIGLIPALSFFLTIGTWAQAVAGAAMAVAIAHALGAPPFVLFSAAAVGYAANAAGGAGGPLAVLLVTIVAVECGKAVSKETKVDILVTPFVTVFIGGGLAMLIAPHIGTAVSFVGKFIGWATELQPLLMGLIISVVMGLALTLPISSAAICAAIGLSGAAVAGVVPENATGLALAGGAAVAGCCAQMVGFAVMSFRENRWGGLVSQGIGTSMIQMPNIVRNPRIWIPPTLASAVTGPLATCVFKLQMYDAAINSGMGTCGLLGPIGIMLGWFKGEYPHTVGAMDWVGLVLTCFVLPAIISWAVCLVLRRIGWIGENDLLLEK
ncbi:MAG: PTS sugar transporter subunit IIC [Clostridia bacterium]|nr:PTS sugar transporter subunit IIC [Clostridia bacterium]